MGVCRGCGGCRGCGEEGVEGVGRRVGERENQKVIFSNQSRLCVQSSQLPLEWSTLIVSSRLQGGGLRLFDHAHFVPLSNQSPGVHEETMDGNAGDQEVMVWMADDIQIFGGNLGKM